LIGIDPELREAFGDNVIEFCLHTCFADMINTIRFRKPNEVVHVFIDEAMIPALGQWAVFYKTIKGLFPEISGVGFAPVKKVIALQGADIIATETYQYGLEWLKNRDQPKASPHFKEFLKRELTVGRILDRDHIQEGINRFRALAASRDGQPA
jgi:hypothetical protein